MTELTNALTKAELDYLEDLLNSGDRAGYYIAYYNMTGSDQTLEQAQITTFSNALGGVAWMQNYLIKWYIEEYGTSQEQSAYDSVYNMSQLVAMSHFEKLEEENGKDNPILTDLQVVQSAEDAWIIREPLGPLPSTGSE